MKKRKEKPCRYGISRIIKPDLWKGLVALIWMVMTLPYLYILSIIIMYYRGPYYFGWTLNLKLALLPFFPVYIAYFFKNSPITALIAVILSFYLFSCIFVEAYRIIKYGKKGKTTVARRKLNIVKNIKKLLKFNRLRWTLFGAIFLLLPVTIIYPYPRACAIGCEIGTKLCISMVQSIKIPLISGLFLAIEDCFRCYPDSLKSILAWSVPKNLIIAFFGSYILDWGFWKYKKRGKSHKPAKKAKK